MTRSSLYAYLVFLVEVLLVSGTLGALLFAWVCSCCLVVDQYYKLALELVTSQILPIVDIKFNKEKDKVIPDEAVNLVEFAPMVNMKAKGKKLTSYKVKEINLRISEEIILDDYEEEDENIGENGMSPMELHRRAMEKLDPNNFKGKDGQINFEF